MAAEFSASVVVDTGVEGEVVVTVTAGPTIMPPPPPLALVDAVWVTVLVEAPMHWLLVPQVNPDAQQPLPRDAGQDDAPAGQAVAMSAPVVTVVVDV